MRGRGRIHRVSRGRGGREMEKKKKSYGLRTWVELSGVAKSRP